MLRTIIGGGVVVAAAAMAFGQTVVDPNLKVQTWVSGLTQPTGMAFVDSAGTALVLEKSTGKVQIVSGRNVVGTALDLPVAKDSEHGLLGIALAPDFGTGSSFVYLSYTSALSDGGAAIDNRVERYRWNGSKLTFDKKILVRPATPGPNHNAGKIAFGPDGKLYVASGDLNLNQSTQNFRKAKTITATSSILRVNADGSSVASNPFYHGNDRPLDDIYAYGIRNTFGMAFDPVTGGLWDTENGPDHYDEINRITPGFNSGWQSIMGPLSRNGGTTAGKLVSLGPAAHYEDPKLSLWITPVAPTDAFFMPTTRLGHEYKDDLFVGTVLDGGVIYDMDLTHTRKALSLTGPLADGIADNTSDALLAEQSGIVFGNGFGTVTDIQSGPGGMYVLSLTDGDIFRITTDGATPMSVDDVAAVPEASSVAVFVIALAALRRRRIATAPFASERIG